MTRLKFFNELGSELVKPATKPRAFFPGTGLPTPVQAAMETFICPLPQERQENREHGKEIAILYILPEFKRR